MKWARIQAPKQNRSIVYIGDTVEAILAKSGLSLSAGDSFTIDLSGVDRPLFTDLNKILFAGDYGGDRIVVAYLEEENG